MLLRFRIIALLIFVVPALIGIARVPARAAGDDPQTLLSEARSRASTGQTAEAIALYRRLLTLSPDDPDVRLELGRLLTRDARTRPEAEKVFAEAAALAPRMVVFAIERAANLAALGDSVNAALEYRRAFELAPDNHLAALGYVQQVARLGAAPVQIAQLSRKLATTPKHFVSRLLLAELLRGEGRYNDALDQYWLAQRDAPNNRVALRGTAETWLALGYFGRAEETFDQAAARSRTAQSRADRARVLIAAGRPEAAHALLVARLAEIEQEPTGVLALADAYRALGLTEPERLTLERKLPVMGSETAPALERLIRIHLTAGDHEGARAICARLLKVDPQNAVAALGLSLAGGTSATTTTTTTSSSTAEAPAARSAGDSEMSPARRAGLDQEAGEAALFLNQPALAGASLRRALSARPGVPRLLLALAAALLQTNDADGAAAAYADVAIAKEPRPDALLGLAGVELLRRRPQRALAIYDNVLRLDPANLRALIGQAEALRQTGDHGRAAVLLTNLTRRAPENNRINAQLGEALAALGRSVRSYVPPPSSSAAASPPPPPRAGSQPGEGAAPRSAQPHELPLTEPLLEAGDALYVTVVGRPGLSSEVRLDENGRVVLQYLKQPVNARCLTERELSEEIIKHGDERVTTGATIEVAVTEYRRAPLLIAGAVHLPGGFYVRNNLDLRESLMLAGGVGERAGTSIYVIRGAASCGHKTSDRRTDRVEAYARAAAEEGRVRLEHPLQAGDVVIVPDADAAFITGAVARPGIVAARGGKMLLETLQSLGGVLEGGRRDRVRLRRLLPDGTSRQQFVIDLTEIEQQRVGDVILQPGDIVDIPATGGEDRARSFAAVLKQAARRGGGDHHHTPPAAGSMPPAPRDVVTAKPRDKEP